MFSRKNFGSVIFEAPDDYQEKRLNIVPREVASGKFKQDVFFVNERLSVRSAAVLNPSEIDMTAILELGTTIDPGNVGHLMDSTELPDSRKFDADFLEYIQKNEESIRSLIEENKK